MHRHDQDGRGRLVRVRGECAPSAGPQSADRRRVWDLVAAELGRADYEPAIVDLTGTVEGGPPYCLSLARAIAG